MNIDFESIAQANWNDNDRSSVLMWGFPEVEACMKQAIEAYKSSLPNSNAGRKANENTLEIRNLLKAVICEHKNKTHTTKSLLKYVSCTLLEINNALSYLEKQGIVRKVGKKTDHGQGRPLTLWKAR